MSEESSTETALGSRYRIERELGQGGMGRLYAAVDEQLGRRVAVKLIRNEVNDVMELLEGETLAARLTRNALSEPEAVRILPQRGGASRVRPLASHG